jgi:eukaryotic-like serine/threonine-protein kinase
MKELRLTELHTAPFLNSDAQFFTVQEGDTSVRVLMDWGKLPHNTRLFGRLIFGEGRVFARLTDAKTPSGETFKVCIEVWDIEGGRGAIREPDDGGPERARIFSTVRVSPVQSFQ